MTLPTDPVASIDDADRTFAPSESYTPTVTVRRDILPMIVQHAMELYWDGSTPTKRLDDREGSSKFTRFVNARIEGKLSEVAFTQLLEQQFDVRATVDFRIYGDYETTDTGDLQHLLGPGDIEYPPGVEFDLKKTKPWNSWLAIRREIYDKIDPEAPVILTKLFIEPELNVDPWLNARDWDDVDEDDRFRNRLLTYADEVFPVDVEFVGTAYPTEFTESFAKGDRLYNPVNGSKIGPPLKRPNEAIAVQNLDRRASRWNRVVGDIVAPLVDADGEWRPLPIVSERPD